MTLYILIKKEIIQFLRNKTDVLTMFIFPIILIVVMGTALNGLMNVDKNIFENKDIYYKKSGTKYEELYNIFINFKKSCTDTIKVNFIEVKDNKKAIDSVNNGDSLCFIEIKDNDYDYYKSQNRDISSQKIFKNIFEQYIKRYTLIENIGANNPNIIQDILNEESLIFIKEEGINNKGIDSFTYYTFAELILIMMYVSGITSISMYKEGLQGTITRIRMSKTSNLSVILSKIILGIIIGILQTIVIYLVSTVFLGVNWGNDLIQIFMVIVSFIIFSSVLGVASSMIFSDNKTASSFINTVIIILGFLGGSYMPISLIKSTKLTNILCQLTPTYWANISLLSLSTGLNSDYTYISISLSLSISAILILLASIVNKLKTGDRFA